MVRSRRSPTAVRAFVVVTLGLGSLTLAACSDDEDAASTSSSPDSAGPVEGAALYASACGECHGDDLRGTDRGPSHLSIVYEPNHHSDDSFRSAIAVGVRAHHWDFGDMPPVEGLTRDEVEAIIAYVREQQELHGFEQ